MDALKRAGAAVALIAAVPAHAQTVDRWQSLIIEASTRFRVPVEWIARVMHAESRGMTMWQGRPITSRAGAMGLMQLMPPTWEAMRSRLGLGGNPYDPHDNVMAGTLYLRLMYDRFGYPGLFGAYSAGPARYGAYVAAGKTLPAETRVYMATLSNAANKCTSAPIAVPDRLFFMPGAHGIAPTATSTLFVSVAIVKPRQADAVR